MLVDKICWEVRRNVGRSSLCCAYPSNQAPDTNQQHKCTDRARRNCNTCDWAVILQPNQNFSNTVSGASSINML